MTNSNQTSNTGDGTGRLWESSPTIAVNPLNRNQMAMAYTEVDPNVGTTGTPVQARLRFSTNGGATWSTVGIGGVLLDPTSTNGAEPFEQVTDAQAAFDRDGHLYVLTSQHTPSNNEGVLLLNKFNVVGNSLVKDGAVNNKQLATWSDLNSGLLNQVIKPVLAVDATVASYTDPDDTDGNPTQTNARSGSVYVAWGTSDETPTGMTNWNANRALLIASGDGGQTFTVPAVINDNDNSSAGSAAGQDGVRAVNPQIAISQGAADGHVAGGLVTVIYEDIAGLNDGRGRILADQVTFDGTALTTRSDVEVARTTVKSNVGVGGAVVSAATPVGIGAGAVIASDNTLGLYSPYQGRLYVAFVDRDPTTGNAADNTDIWVKASDDGGRTWSVLANPAPNPPRTANNASGDDSDSVRVNDDNAAVDGYLRVADQFQHGRVRGGPGAVLAEHRGGRRDRRGRFVLVRRPPRRRRRPRGDLPGRLDRRRPELLEPGGGQ